MMSRPSRKLSNGLLEEKSGGKGVSIDEQCPLKRLRLLGGREGVSKYRVILKSIVLKD